MTVEQSKASQEPAVASASEPDGLAANAVSASISIEVDRDVCMGSGNCVYEAPGAFALDADGIASVVDPTSTSEDKVRAAARKCPTHAITVTAREQP
jgi:ferredoxin